MKRWLRKKIFWFVNKNSKSAAQKYDTSVEHIYTDPEGNKWYAYSDLLNMGILRKLQLDEIQDLAEAKLTKEDLEIFIKNLNEALLEKDYDHIRMISAALELRMQFIASRNPYKQMVAAVYLLEGEDPIKLDPSAFRKKLEILDKFEDVEDFFLRDFLRRWRNFSKDYEERFMNYLQTIKTEEQITHFMIRKKSPKVKLKEEINRKNPRKGSRNSASKTESSQTTA